MARSMTAYGRAVGSTETKNITVEIKSVNSRYFDPQIKISRSFSYLEEKVKNFIQSYISRGKVDVWVGVEVTENQSTEIRIDKAYAETYINALRALRDEFDEFREYFEAKPWEKTEEKAENSDATPTEDGAADESAEALPTADGNTAENADTATTSEADTFAKEDKTDTNGELSTKNESVAPTNDEVLAENADTIPHIEENSAETADVKLSGAEQI